jgi:hypothetical protein
MVHTLLMLGQAEVAVPAGHKHHVISQVFALNLELLHNHNVRLQDIEHGIKGPLVAPWLISKWIANAIDIPRRDADHDVRW